MLTNRKNNSGLFH